MIVSAGKYLFSVRYDSAMEKSSLSGWIAAILQSCVIGLVVYDRLHNERVSLTGSNDGFKPRGCFERMIRPGFSHRCVALRGFQNRSAAVLSKWRFARAPASVPLSVASLRLQLR